MDITPLTHFLKSMRGERVDYVALCGEGVDNAFDAEASQVAITIIRDEQIAFEDDGVGVTSDRIAALFRLGQHGRMTTTQLGRFGMGIKVQAINAGDVLDILSTSVEGRVRLRADWQEIVKHGKWEVPDPKWSALRSVDGPTGTTLTISQLRPARYDVDKIRWQLALRFHPALVGGRRIVLNGHEIAPVAEPEMTDIVSAHLQLSKGRSVRIRAGILVRPSKLRAVHVAYSHRVIMPESNIGCDNYSGLNSIFARLTIEGPWHLGQFKDELTDEDERDELEAAALEVMRPILEKVDRAAMNARVNEMRDLLNDMIPAELGARPKGQGNRKTPAKEKTKSGEVEAEKSSREGPAKSVRAPKNQLTITFDGVAEDHGIGNFEPGRPHRVNLSRDESTIAGFLEVRGRDRDALKALYAVAMCLYVQGLSEREPQLEMFEEGFGKAVANLLAKQSHDDEDKVDIA